MTFCIPLSASTTSVYAKQLQMSFKLIQHQPPHAPQTVAETVATLKWRIGEVWERTLRFSGSKNNQDTSVKPSVAVALPQVISLPCVIIGQYEWLIPGMSQHTTLLIMVCLYGNNKDKSKTCYFQFQIIQELTGLSGIAPQPANKRSSSHLHSYVIISRK